MTAVQSSAEAGPRIWAPVRRWFDAEAADTRDGIADPRSVDWFRVVPFVLIHVGCVLAFLQGASLIALGVAAFLFFLRMFAITGFYHRYFSHRTFKTSRPAQFLFGVLGNSAAQRGPLWWAAQHRHHHRHSDGPEDYHSPHQHGFLWSHMLWVLSRGSFKTDLNLVRDLARFPELRWLNRFDSVVPLATATLVFAVGWLLQVLAPGLGTSGYEMLLWGFCVSTTAVFHCTCLINSLAHRVGTRRYATSDDSRNSFVLALLTLGEGWHNNHHHFPSSVRQGFYWWEVDLSYYGLLALEKLGIIWDLKGVPASVLERARVDQAAVR